MRLQEQNFRVTTFKTKEDMIKYLCEINYPHYFIKELIKKYKGLAWDDGHPCGYVVFHQQVKMLYFKYLNSI